MVISREFIQEVCAPFFEQMLTALHREVNARLEGEAYSSGLLSTAPWKKRDFSGVGASAAVPPPPRDDGPVLSSDGAFSAVFDQAPLTPVRRQPLCHPGDEPRSVKPDVRIPRVGEFEPVPQPVSETLLLPAGPQAVLQSGTTGLPGATQPGGSAEGALPATLVSSSAAEAGRKLRLAAATGPAATEAMAAAAFAASVAAAERDSGSGEEAVRSVKNVSVCHHWKAKGLCRLGESCKFLHPEHKKGRKPAQKAGKGGSAAQHPAGQEEPMQRQSRQLAQHRAGAGTQDPEALAGVEHMPLAFMVPPQPWPQHAGSWCEEVHMQAFPLTRMG
jgi:hypothetical protein